MKLRPRFTLRTLAIVVTLCAFSVCGITWPQKTSETFVKLLSEQKFDDVNRLVATNEDREFLESMAIRNKPDPRMEEIQREMEIEVRERLKKMGIEPPVREPIPEKRQPFKVELYERSWSDILLGKAFFALGMDTGCYVQRGRVSFPVKTVPFVGYCPIRSTRFA